MLLEDFKRLIRPLTAKIFLLLGRLILKAIDNSQGTMKIQVVGLDGEIITGMERFQEYGFESYPFSDSQVAAIFLNGNRDHGIALCIHDRRYRPKDLAEGEVCVYTDEDLQNGQYGLFREQFMRNRIFFRRCDIQDIDIDTSATEDIGQSKTVTVPSEVHTNATEHKIDSPEVSLGGNNFGALKKLIKEEFQTLFNEHKHGGISTGAGTSGVPTTLITDTHMTTKVKGV